MESNVGGEYSLSRPHNFGSVGFFSTYRPPKPLDLFSLGPASCSPFNFDQNECRLTDGKSYNYNGQAIPKEALKLMLQRPKLSHVGTEDDVDSGDLFGLLLVSERHGGLETIHFSFILREDRAQVFSFADVYGIDDKVRMEDSPVIAGEYLVYVSTKEPALARRQPWTAVYQTHLVTGVTNRLTPPGIADLNPAVSPCGTMIAVASFECKEGGWQGEIEDLMTNIFVFRKEMPLIRQEIVKNGGWPSWGSNNVIYFHRKRPNTKDEEGKPVLGDWAVFRADLSCHIFPKIDQITPDNIKAFTPAAIDENTVVVCTIRAPLVDSSKLRADIEQYRQIEIFDYEKPKESVLVTQGMYHNADHYNPFVLHQSDGLHIGYHRCVYLLQDDSKHKDTVESHQLMNLNSPIPRVELFRVSGVFPTFSKDGNKLAFVDNEFQAVWVADGTSLSSVYEIPEDVKNQVWAPIWSQDPKKDILYFCQGISFSLTDKVDIMAIFNVSTKPSIPFPTVKNCKNNAFPCTNPDGTRLVFRSAELRGQDPSEVPNKYLYIREEADQEICIEHTKVKQLTTKSASYTHCDWSPNGKWIVFSATLDKPNDAPKSDNNLDPGYYAIYLLAVDNSDVMVRVLHSGPNFAGHVNHPFFSPDGNGIVIASDLAAVSCDPISLPIFIHSVRPYGDIFTIEIDSEKIENNKDIEKYTRMTHSRYENSTCTWTSYSTKTHPRGWNLILDQPHVLKCPYFDQDGKEGWQMTGHLCIPHRRC